MPYTPTRIYGPAQPLSVATIPGAPTLSASGTGTTVTATAKYFVITHANARGETPASTQATITPTAGNTITVTAPTFPDGVTSVNVYEGTVNGGPYYLKGSVTTSAGTLAVTSEPSVTTQPPTTNTATVSSVITPTPALTTGSVLKEVTLTNSFQNSGAGGLELTLNGFPIVSVNPVNSGNTVIIPFSKPLQASDVLAVLQQSAANIITIDLSVEKV